MKQPAADYVIRRGGGFYRPKAAGYTLSLAEAGRWSKGDAYAYQLNVEGVTVHHVSEFKPDRLSILVDALEKVRSYNVEIAAGRINYRPHDHIQVIDEALSAAGLRTHADTEGARE